VRKLEQKANELEQEIQARREAEYNFRNVLENANEAIIISGPDRKHLVWLYGQCDCASWGIGTWDRIYAEAVYGGWFDEEGKGGVG